MAATKGGPTKVVRLGITNVYNENDYTAQLTIGSIGAMANVTLDTGSSTIAVDPSVYRGAGDKDLKPTTLIQLVAYGTGGWAGPVVDTMLSLRAANGTIILPSCPVAITSVQEKGNFQGETGILGLAYNGLNDAYDFKNYLVKEGRASSYPWPFGSVWSTFDGGFKRLVKKAGARKINVTPYFDQVEEAGIVANKFAFYTLRSCVSFRLGKDRNDRLADPLNKGYFILGGGEEHKDLYTGEFSEVRVLHDLYYNTNLKSVRVHGCPAHTAAALQPKYRHNDISNSIIDSGTSYLPLAEDVYHAILQGLRQINPAFIHLIEKSNKADSGIAAASLDLARWPNIYFTLEGDDSRDVELVCRPQTYWQTDYPAAGRAVFQISGPLVAGENQSVLGLPLMNNYYTVFDRTEDVKGVISFAAIKYPS